MIICFLSIFWPLTFVMLPGGAGCAVKGESEQKYRQEGTNRNTHSSTFNLIVLYLTLLSFPTHLHYSREGWKINCRTWNIVCVYQNNTIFAIYPSQPFWGVYYEASSSEPGFLCGSWLDKPYSPGQRRRVSPTFLSVEGRLVPHLTLLYKRSHAERNAGRRSLLV